MAPVVELVEEEKIEEKPKKKDRKKKDKPEVSPIKEIADIQDLKSAIQDKMHDDFKVKKAKKKKREPEPEVQEASPEKKKKKKRKKDKKEAKEDKVCKDPNGNEEIEYKRSIKMEEIDSKIKPKIKKASIDKIEAKIKENSPKKKNKHKK